MDATQQLQDAADRAAGAARKVRGAASDLVSDADDSRGGTAGMAANALSTMSDGLEALAESARASGFAMRDRGRDAAKALSRGERVLREGGLPGAAVGTAVLAKRHAKTIAVAGIGLLTFLVVRRLNR
ncbi:MAG TPA: hypothetical protein VJ997_01805 [Longimicrobiales bacterium]|nr:hypothetical protein [Longimicrobiales bacterium]